LGFMLLSSLIRVPNPPAKITTFTVLLPDMLPTLSALNSN